jgi:outer membrane protein TolC
VLRVTQAYWDTQLAAGRLIALDTALVAARAHERQAEAMRDQGLVTGLDARMARLQAASVEVQRLAAAAAADNARARLAAFLGLPDTSVIQLVDSLSERGDATCADTSPACTIDERGDLRALAAGAGAADLGAKGAWAAQLPQVAAFGAIARHAHDAPWGEGSGDWTVGIGVRWNVFPALSGVAAVRRARADADAARARLDAARLEATVEAGEARRMVASARAGAAVAGGAELEGAEALEQARLRYRTGSAPITELLDVQAAATQAVLTHQSAQRDLLLALALLDFAYGVHDR